MKTFFAFLGVFILCALSPLAVMGVISLQYEGFNQATTVTTGGGATTATVTLTQTPDPNQAATLHSLASNLAGDTLAIVSYTPNTNALALSGLLESETRLVTISYNIPSRVVTQFPYFSSFIPVFVVLLGVGLLGLLIAVVWAAFSGRLN